MDSRDGSPGSVSVFTGGEEGHNVYRIPSLVVTSKGALLAFCEGRRSISDAAQNAIVLKRSIDGGNTWSSLQVVARMGKDSLNNPTAVVVRDTGRVILMFQRYPYPSTELMVVKGSRVSFFKKLFGFRVLDSWMITSDDDGLTWSEPREITSQVKPTIATSIASGPGTGIQLLGGPHAGRLVVPFNCGPFRKWQVYAAFSDDLGETWQIGSFAPAAAEGHANEVQMVELAKGKIMLNARKQGGKNKVRLVATSDDGGETWSRLVEDPVLVDPRCQGSITRVSDLRDDDATEPVIAFANPAAPDARVNGTLRLSKDGGKTWPVTIRLDPGAFAYCCLAALPGNVIGCLYETGEPTGYERIVLARVPVP